MLIFFLPISFTPPPTIEFHSLFERDPLKVFTDIRPSNSNASSSYGSLAKTTYTIRQHWAAEQLRSRHRRMHGLHGRLSLNQSIASDDAYEKERQQEQNGHLSPFTHSMDNRYTDRAEVVTVFRSFFDLIWALYGVIFEVNSEIKSTTQYESMNRDLLLLESPFFEIPLAQKIATTYRMRQSYNCLAPNV